MGFAGKRFLLLVSRFIQTATLFHCFSIKCCVTCNEHDVNKMRNSAGNSRSQVKFTVKTSTYKLDYDTLTRSLLFLQNCLFSEKVTFFLRFRTAVSTKFCILFSFQQLPEKVLSKKFDLFSLSVTLNKVVC